MSIFEQASRLKLRFDLQGNISTEQLWDVDLDNLVTYEEQLIEVVASYGKSTRRKTSRKTNEQATNELRLAVVASILDTRIKEQEEAQEAAANKAHNQEIMEQIAEKQKDELKGKSIEELKAMLK